jgi:hypothetical protein
MTRSTETRSTDGPASGSPAPGMRPAATRTARRWFRRGGSRLSRALDRNAEWVAEAQYTPPLHAQHNP